MHDLGAEADVHVPEEPHHPQLVEEDLATEESPDRAANTAHPV